MVPRSMRRVPAMEASSRWWLGSVDPSAWMAQVSQIQLGDAYPQWQYGAGLGPLTAIGRTKPGYAADCSGVASWAWRSGPEVERFWARMEEPGKDKDICSMDELCDVLEAVG